MGGAHTASARGAAALHYNPAGLGGGEWSEAAFMHNQYFQGMTQEHVSAAFKNGWGAAVNYLDYGPVERTTVSSKDGTLGQAGGSEMSLGLGYGLRPAKYYAVGAGAKFIRGSLDLVTANSYALDLGLLYFPTSLPGLSGGFSIQNIGSEVRYQSSREKLPLLYRGGAAVKFATDLYEGSFSADIIYRPHREAVVGVGAEVLVAKMMALRFGYSNRNNSGLGLTGGLGWFYRNYIVDYTMAPFGFLGFSHRVGITMRWGSQAEVARLGAVSRQKQKSEPALEAPAAQVETHTPVKPKPAPAPSRPSPEAPIEEEAEADVEEEGPAPLDMRYFAKREKAAPPAPPPRQEYVPRPITPAADGPAPARPAVFIAPLESRHSGAAAPARPAAATIVDAMDKILRHPAGSTEREEALRSLSGRSGELKAVRALAVQAISTVLRDETRSAPIMALSLRLLASLEDKASAPMVRNFLYNGRSEIVAEAARALALLSDQESVAALEELVSRLDKDPRFDVSRGADVRANADAVREALNTLKAPKSAVNIKPQPAKPAVKQDTPAPQPKKSKRKLKPPKRQR